MWSGREEHRERDSQRNSANCPLWCDTDFTPDGADSLRMDELVTRISHVGDNLTLCVLTGGEPLLQADGSLVRALQDEGFRVAVETNGTVRIREAFDDGNGRVVPPDWIVCSPKLPQDQLRIEYCHELKLIVPDYRPSQYDEFVNAVRTVRLAGEERTLLWLQPEEGQRYDQARKLAAELVLKDPRWSVSLQTHKYLGVQ